MGDENDAKSEIQTFFKDKTVFVTGGSGFLGKVFIEKLLRTTDVKRVYVLIRDKRGKNALQRIADWKNEAIFGLLLNTNASRLNCILPINGDCQVSDLGISQVDRQLLIDEVQVVVHSAASIRFDELLHKAVDINTRATHLMLQLAKQMPRLEAYVHVSTAYSNCVIDHISERLYPENVTCNAGTILTLREQLSDELLDSMMPALKDKYPNTYTYTKALAEQLVQKEGSDLPVCIFRPGIIIGSYKDPVPGWVDNLAGPMGIILGTGLGIVRVTQMYNPSLAHCVPVDYCVNLMMASASHTAREYVTRKKNALTTSSVESSQLPPIYNYVLSDKNILTWGSFKNRLLKLVAIYPLTKMMWMPITMSASSSWTFNLMAFFYHILPGHLIDIVLRLRGRQPRMIKIYHSIHRQLKVLSPFVTNNWYFNTHNTDKLWMSLSPQDQKLFEFDMSSLDWDDYLYQSIGGMRMYLGKEENTEESFQRARIILSRFKILNRLVHIVIFSGVAAILWTLSKLWVRF